MARVHRVDGNIETPLAGGWQCASLAPGQVDHPSALDGACARWFDARVPGTAASALAAASAWNVDDVRDFDSEDWWFRHRVTAMPPAASRMMLRFGGLATIADVWVDGNKVLGSNSMFIEHEVDVTERLHDGSEIVIRFAALGEELKKRRPRPRWRAQLVAQQQLRWFRTTLLGRIPEWAPFAAPVGPYRPVCVEARAHLAVVAADVATRLEGRDGVCEATLRLLPLGGTVNGVSLTVGGERTELVCNVGPDGVVVARGASRVRDVSLWWPSSHGEPALYDVGAVARVGPREVAISLGRTGFRTIELDRSAGSFGVRVNGIEVFCRGACWTPLDVVGLGEDPATLRATLSAVRAAGMNMLRLNGTMLYASHAFHDLCDELGILVWQDFMFANMDYPFSDPAFSESVRVEAEQLIDRLQLSPSLAVVCGNTEVEQQAAMVGVPKEHWANALFSEFLPSVVSTRRRDVPYCRTTPTGGDLPFHVQVGVSHYYGVGAYRRPLDDARRSRVRFAAECLGFGNIPCDETIEEFMRGEVPTNHPRWKGRVPRDRGAAWDFDDVRDHYVRELFGVDPATLRVTDIARYLELGRVATGEVMAAAMAEWRRAGSECRGALVWFLRDLLPGAGWGLIDARGCFKAGYYFLRRVLQPIALLPIDEGLNGLALHAINDTPQPLNAQLRVGLYRDGQTAVAEGATAVSVPPHGAVTVTADTVIGRFADSTYAYRFGPPGHDLVVATLVGGGRGARLAQAFFFPCGRPIEQSSDLGTEAFAEGVAPEQWRVTVRTQRFAQAIAFDAPGYLAEDDFFDLEPGGECTVTLRGRGPTLSARIRPLNATAPTKVTVRPKDISSASTDHWAARRADAMDPQGDPAKRPVT